MPILYGFKIILEALALLAWVQIVSKLFGFSAITARDAARHSISNMLFIYHSGTISTV